MKNIIFFILLIICGCIEVKPVIQPTKQWENHYYNLTDFQEATKDIKLEKGETIWVLSNSTLSRLLKNIKEK